jgi:IstB-like ATP binding protein
MTAVSDTAAQAAIGAAACELRLPTVRAEAARLAEIAVRERHTHLGYLDNLAEVLSAELDDRSGRRRARSVAEAKFPRIKRLSDFNADAVPAISPAQLARLASGAYLDVGEPVVLLGDSPPGRRDRGPGHLERPHPRDRHPVLSALHQQDHLAAQASQLASLPGS